MRPKDTAFDKAVKKAMKEAIEDIKSGRAVKRDLLARNKLIYHYINHGVDDVEMAIEKSQDVKVSGFEAVINALFSKAIAGDVRAIKMIMNLAGLEVDKVEAPQDEGTNTFQLKYNLGE